MPKIAFYFLVLINKGEFIMPRDKFDRSDFNNNFDSQNLKRGLSGTFSFGELTGEAETRPSTPKKKKTNIKRGRSKSVNVRSKNAKAGRTFEKPSALVNKTGLKNNKNNKNKGIFSSILDMFHGVGSKEKNMTISSRNTVEEIKEQLDKLYDRIKEYENKLESKSKEVSLKLVDLSKKVSKLNKEVTRSQRRINMFEKQIKGYESDLDKIKDTGDLEKQNDIAKKIEELRFKIKEEQKKLESHKSKLKPLAEKKEALEKKSKEIKKSIANLKKKSIAIDQKLGCHSVSKESTFEILRRSIKENARRREIEPSQVSNENRAFRTTWNSKTYSFGNPEALKDLSVKGLTFRGLNLEKPRLNWLEQRLKRAEQNGFSTTPSDERENNKEHGGKDNPDR